MDSLRTCAALLTGLLLAACSDSGGGASTLAPGVHPTDLDASAWSARDGWVVTRIRERGVDLNGDGDRIDQVLAFVEARTGASYTLPVASGGFLLAPPWVVFQAFERESGDSDLNGDGDPFDIVLLVHDLRDRTTRNLGLALPVTADPAASVEGDRMAFLASESFQGADLDGDGFVAGDVLHLVDLRGGPPLPLGFACAAPPIVSGGRVLFLALERNADLNGDGDTFDSVLHVHDPVLGETHNLRRAVFALPTEILAAGDLMTVLVPEFAQGVDLNGDGDLSDSLLEIHDLGTRRSILVTAPTTSVTLSPELVLVGLREAEGPGVGVDRNGDGDVLDTVAAFYDRLTGVLEDTGLALPTQGLAFEPASPPVVSGRTAVFPVDEREQGFLDLDGNGRTLDRVVHVLDGRSGRATSLGVALAHGEKLLGLSGSLVAHATTGRNDPSFVLASVLDLDSGLSTALGVAAERLSLQEDVVLAWVPQVAPDGTPRGTTLVAFEVATGDRFDIDLPVMGPALDPEPVVHEGTVSLLVQEVLVGADLNRDGDTRDVVPVLVRLPFGRR